MDQTRRCGKCGHTLPEAAFNVSRRRRTGRQAWCRACSRAANASHYRAAATRRQRIAEHNRARARENRRMALAYLQRHPCVDCGESDPIVLEFDHIDPRTKRRAITDMLRGGAYPWRTIAVEIAKCAVRCANCHRRRTARQFGSLKLLLLRGEESGGERAGGGG